MLKRSLDVTHYNDSLCLFGPRQTGKTCLIKETLSPDIYIDLLKHSEFLRYANDVSLLSKEVQALSGRGKLLVVLDEIQRVPELLNEVHSLIERFKQAQFVLTGSSARKLRRAGVNLLGGRAITLHLHPFTSDELGESFSLDDALRFGTLPPVSLARDRQHKVRLLRSYVETYLEEEVQREALTRNIPAFARFLELSAFENGHILNFQTLARDVGVHAKTIKEYFQILEDTLLGFFLFPYGKSPRSRLVSHPKFYFFDSGVVRALRKELSSDLLPASPPYGDAFEHWVFLEMKRALDYRERVASLCVVRTTDGVEVDVILERGSETWAIEIKASAAPQLSDVRGLRSFMRDHKVKRAICACQTPRPYVADTIEFLPWQAFLKEV